MRSGSLITAHLANEMGRDVFALPGSSHAPLSRGCHRMLKQGAKLVETPEEILEELGFVPPPARAAGPMPWDSIPAKPGPDGTSRGAAGTAVGTAVGTAAGTATGTATGTPSGAAPKAASPHQTVAEADLGPEAQTLLAALGHAPATLEILAARTDMQDATLQSTLLQLELAGRLTVLPGGRFARVTHR